MLPDKMEVEMKGAVVNPDGVALQVGGDHPSLLEESMKKYDLDGNGTFSIAEVKAIVADVHAAEKKKAHYKNLAIGAIVLVFFSLAAMLGTSIWGAELTKEQHIKDDQLSSLNGNILKAGAATTPMPLLVAPVLPHDTELDTIEISYDSPALGGAHVRERFKVETRVHANDTFVTFYSAHTTAPPILAREVRIWNGETTALLTNGDEVSLCTSEMSCAALKADSREDMYAMLDKAKSALKERFPDKTASRRLYEKERFASPTYQRDLWSTCLD